MATTSRPGTIVITGGSSGFGHVTALHLAKLGWRVFATVRREEDRERLSREAKQQGGAGEITPLICDITNAEQVAALHEAVAAQKPRLDALLNNAGSASAGPLELLPLEQLRWQFEVNTIAHLGVTQALLPLLKTARGTIINVSSVSGRISLPIIGPYAASKFALEALSDALRVELAPFGVRVVLIEPSSSPTGIWQASLERARGVLEPHREGPYARLLNVLERSTSRMASGKGGFPPQRFAETVVKILNSPHPRARYAIPGSVGWQIRLRSFVPDRLWDRQVRRTLRW